jgi:oxygen-independent coproporphyrinogen-3 oxidase
LISGAFANEADAGSREGNARKQDPSPLAVYVHWPYCARICPYCDFNVVRDRGQTEQADLARAIVADLTAQRALTGPRRLSSIYLGGGTPSLMQPAWAEAIIGAATRLWACDDDLEITLEANPTDAEGSRFADFAVVGVNRASLGVQSLHDESLRFLGRNHDAAEARAAIDRALASFSRVSFDLIYALPGQTPEAWAAELNTATGLGAEHISPYQLTFEPGAAMTRAAERGLVIPPPEDRAADLFDVTQSVLEGAGFEAYEVSNHARGAAARSRHNLAYWQGHDYVGAGPGAHGRLTLEGCRSATVAERRVGDYIAAVATAGVGYGALESLTPAAAAEERIWMGLRTDLGVPFAQLAPLNLRADSPIVAQMAADGFVRVDGDRLVATRQGRIVLDRLTLELATGGKPA